MSRSLRKPGAAAAATMLLLTGCAVGPNYHRLALSTSSSYGAEAVSPMAAAEAGAPKLISGMDIPAQWWNVFHSAELDALVAQALKNNPTIDAAKAALRSAREQVKAQRGAFFPSLAASIQPSSYRFARTLASPTFAGNSDYNLTTTQLSISYTPDLFGANRRAVESLVAQQEQQRFELEAVRLTLASNVVLAAVQDALLRAEIDTTRAIIVDQQQILASYQQQHSLGQISDADMAAQEALLAQAQAALPPLEKQFGMNRDLLSSYIGHTPGETLDVRFDLDSLTLPERLPLSLPARLVEQRPDVRIAGTQLQAASAAVGIAAAARWPSIQIEGNIGSAALSLTPSFNNTTNFVSIAGTLTQPLFEGGALLHHERAAKAAYDQAAAQYQGTVIGAFQNTADVLHALWTDASALQLAEAAQKASSKSLRIAQRQLGLGDLSRLAVLSAEQADAQVRLTTLQARATRYTDVAALFQALGGGWWNSETRMAAAKPDLAPP